MRNGETVTSCPARESGLLPRKTRIRLGLRLLSDHVSRARRPAVDRPISWALRAKGRRLYVK